MRKVCYVSGTRADFGLMVNTLRSLHTHPSIDLSICVTAMHLSETYGYTVRDIEAENFRICARIPVDLEKTTGASMGKAIGYEICEMIDVFQTEQPDIVLLLGDRGEMLAAAIAAVHLNIHVAHIHGGERSGTVDEMVRHAISKFAHYHFVATEQSKERLIKMGEQPDNIFVTGAPGLDGVTNLSMPSRNDLCQKLNLNPARRIGLLVYHPVVQEYDSIDEQAQTVLEAALAEELQLVCLLPNSDAGGIKIRTVFAEVAHHPNIRIFTHLARLEYLAWLAAVDVMLGNSSSAIIEAASFNLVAVNIGTRQNLRERGNNIIDTPPQIDAIRAALQQAIQYGKRQWQNIYGDGKAAIRIVQLLTSLTFSKELLQKSNAY